MKILAMLPSSSVDLDPNGPPSLSKVGFERLTAKSFPADFSLKVFCCVIREQRDLNEPKALYGRLTFEDGVFMDASMEISPDPIRAVQKKTFHLTFTLNDPCRMVFEVWTGDRPEVLSWPLRAELETEDHGPRSSL
jgi:hypothetical protein